MAGRRDRRNLVLVYEEGSEASVLWGDDRNEGRAEYADAGVQPPRRDPGTEAHYVCEGRTTMMTVAVHARWSGQAARAAALRAFLEHAQSTPKVSFMRRGDIARWWLETFPPAQT